MLRIRPELRERGNSNVCDAAVGAGHHNHGVIDRGSRLRLHDVINANERDTHDEYHSDSTDAVVHNHGAITTCRHNDCTARAVHERTGPIIIIIATTATCGHISQLLPCQQ